MLIPPLRRLRGTSRPEPVNTILKRLPDDELRSILATERESEEFTFLGTPIRVIDHPLPAGTSAVMVNSRGEGFALIIESGCDVRTLDGKRCGAPTDETFMIRGREVELCRACFDNFLSGAYGRGHLEEIKP